LWTWGLIAGVVAFYLYKRYTENQAATSSTISPTASVLDPNAIDPNTGLTYGQEENAALQSSAISAPGSSSNGAYPTQSSLGQEVTDVTGLIQSLENAGLIPTPGTTTTATPAAPGPAPAPTPTYTPPNIYVTVPPAPVSSTPGVPGPASSPSSAPTTNPSPVAQPSPSVPAALSPAQLASALLTSAGVAGAQAQTYLSGLLSGGYKKVTGTSQTGGLAQTGTYTHSGGPTYYVWGTSTSGLHIRQAVASTPSINAPGQPTPAGGFRP
jgi:hypothetical protein